jgi:hypothetical protein
MMFVDKPNPSLAFILIYAGLALFLIVLPLFLRHFHQLRGALAVVVFTVTFAGAAVLLVFLITGFDTVYSLDNNTLRFRSGFLAKGQAALDDIKEIQTVPMNWEALGWALNRKGFCNRFSNCLRLTTDQTAFFLSPKDPQAFAAEIRIRQKRSNILRKNFIFH